MHAPKAVEQIMSGKTIARVVRAHLLLDAVLNGLLLSKSMDVIIIIIIMHLFFPTYHNIYSHYVNQHILLKKMGYAEV